MKHALEKLLEDMDVEKRVSHDPILFPCRFQKPEDIEVAGFIASAFAYGKVDLFLPVLESIFAITGDSPYAFCLNFDPLRDSSRFNGIYYRFNTARDVATLLFFVGKCLRETGSLSDLFYRYCSAEQKNVMEAVVGFLSWFRSLNPEPVTGERAWSHGLKHIFPSPEGGSPLKRFNLFLRWMVRKKGVDFGIWDRVSPSKLVIPLDTHILRVGRNIGLTGRSASNIGTALDITSNLAKFDVDDPVKYDFALCHFGIARNCPQKPSALNCKNCVLSRICKRPCGGFRVVNGS